MSGGGASPCDLPERRALDAQASLARRVGASAALVDSLSWLSSPFVILSEAKDLPNQPDVETSFSHFVQSTV